MSNVAKEKAVISFHGEVLFGNVPMDGDQHMITLMVSPEGLDLYIDGSPVNPDTGDAPYLDIVAAADAMVSLWRNGGWKLSTDTRKIQAAIDSYQNARGSFNGQPDDAEVDQALPEIVKQHKPTVRPSEPVLVRDPNTRPGWGPFIAFMQQKTGRSEIPLCMKCKEPLPAYENLVDHWLLGHWDGWEALRNLQVKGNILRGMMPQREGPSAD